MALGWIDCRDGLRSAYHAVFRLGLRWKCRASDLTSNSRRDGVAIPPALLRYRVGESLSVREFLAVGSACAGHIDECLRSVGSQLLQGQHVLDFGCGCSRVLPFLQQRYPGVHFHGVDVDSEAIAWSSEHIADVDFQCTGALPPLPYPAGYFDVIYAISVFTHLDERLQDQWLRELHRILKSGGTLLLTIHGEHAAATLADADKDALLQVGFLHKSSRKLRGIVPGWYNTTWHTQGYILNRVSRLHFEVNYRPIEGSTQAFIIARAYF